MRNIIGPPLERYLAGNLNCLAAIDSYLAKGLALTSEFRTQLVLPHYYCELSTRQLIGHVMYCFDETVINKILLKLKFNFRKYKMNFTLSAELPYINM